MADHISAQIQKCCCSHTKEKIEEYYDELTRKEGEPCLLDILMIDAEKDEALRNQTLRKLKELLDEYAFGNKLRDVRIVSTKHVPEGFSGCCRWYKPNEGTAPYVLIEVHPSPVVQHPTLSGEIFGIVTHECIHAYLMIELY